MTYWRGPLYDDDDFSFMTYDMFRHDLDIYTRRSKAERKGQAAYNMLASIRPELARSINAGPLDPFYVDSILPDFFTHIEQHWDDTFGQ